ncbi:MFS-type transporter SLC18B1 [Orchesella cincta]|uniref:MFS-type transporter SLC18B1 n=1 Tax=Orchesella cincta TaxID=48709 RepID=A0A1D2MWK6_ORCCI|nr:MFS-type transporter SLC18B1 [Orchesella cincta]
MDTTVQISTKQTPSNSDPDIINHSSGPAPLVNIELEAPGKESAEEKSKSANFLVSYFHRKTQGLSRSQILILCIFPFVEFFAATVISIQGPFYPDVAKSKGASSTESGLVFGIFELTVFITAPIFGAKMGKWNPHRVFNYGIFTTSLMCMIFGFLHHVDSRAGFIALSAFVRTIEAIGDAAFVVASFSIIAAEFPDTVATTFAMMETFYGLGMIFGPVSVVLCTKTSTVTVDSSKVVSSSSFNMFKMLKIPVITLTAYGTLAAATGIGFLANNLERHLTQFGLNHFEVGLIYMLNGGVYALSAPFFGKFSEKSSQPKIFSVVGSFLTILGFLLIGPFPLPFWTTTIPLICIGLVIFGLGLGSTLVSAFIIFLQDAIASGYADDVRTYGLTSGLWTSMTALGFFLGPVAGGLLEDVVGFRWGTLFILTQQLILVVLLAKFFMSERSPANDNMPKKMEDEVDNSVLKNKDEQPTPSTSNNGKVAGLGNPGFVGE